MPIHEADIPHLGPPHLYQQEQVLNISNLPDSEYWQEIGKQVLSGQTNSNGEVNQSNQEDPQNNHLCGAVTLLLAASIKALLMSPRKR